MILLGNILGGIGYILHMVIYLAVFLFIARAVISWVNADPYNPIVRFLSSSTDPMLAPIQKRIPLIGPGIDISPIILLFGLYFLDFVLVNSLYHYAAELNPMLAVRAL